MSNDPHPDVEQELLVQDSEGISVHVRELTTSDMPAFLTLRAEALHAHPEAFIPSPDEGRSRLLTTLTLRVRNHWMMNGSFLLGAFREDRLVGVVGVLRSVRVKQRHTALVWMLYTDPSVRSQGIARNLLLTAIDRCRRDPDLELLRISVGSESHAARQLYTSLGFEAYGQEPRALKLADRYIDILFMTLDVISV